MDWIVSGYTFVMDHYHAIKPTFDDVQGIVTLILFVWGGWKTLKLICGILRRAWLSFAKMWSETAAMALAENWLKWEQHALELEANQTFMQAVILKTAIIMTMSLGMMIAIAFTIPDGWFRIVILWFLVINLAANVGGLVRPLEILTNTEKECARVIKALDKHIANRRGGLSERQIEMIKKLKAAIVDREKHWIKKVRPFQHFDREEKEKLRLDSGGNNANAIDTEAQIKGG